MTASTSAPRWIAAALLLWLAALVIGTGFAAIVLLNSGDDYLESASYQVVLCVTGGAFGAAVAALLRAVERMAHGWGDGAGTGVHGFSARRAPLLAVQPVLGAALGLLLYLLLSALVVVLLRVSDGTVFDPQGLLLVAGAAGLFARALLARLRDMVDALFGRPAAAPPTLQVMPPPAAARRALAEPAAADPAADAVAVGSDRSDRSG